MKKILFTLLLFTGYLQAQTYPVNPTKFGKISLNTNTEDNSAIKINVQSSNNSVNWIEKSSILKTDSISNNSFVSGATATEALNYLSANKANDLDALHKTGNETKNGDLSVVGNFNVSTGSAFTNIISSLASGNVYFLNDQAGFNVPTLVGKSSNSIGLSLMSSTPDDNMTDDMRFSVRSLSGTDFTDNTKSAFNFVRGGANSLLKILRDGDSFFLKNVTIGGKLTWGSGTYVSGDSQIYNTAIAGTQLVGKTGSLSDFQLINGLGQGVYSVPTGTRNVVFDNNIYAGRFVGDATLTGTPTAPTAAAGTDTDQIATTAFVQSTTNANAVLLTGNQTKLGTLTFDSNSSGTLDSSLYLRNDSTSLDGILGGRNFSTGNFFNFANSSTGTLGLIQEQGGGVGLRISAGIGGTTGTALVLKSDSGHGSLKLLSVVENSTEKAFIDDVGNLSAQKITANNVIKLKNYTVSTLPAGTQGDTAFVTDALAPTYMATVVGGGTVVTPVFYNGTAWVCH